MQSALDESQSYTGTSKSKANPLFCSIRLIVAILAMFGMFMQYCEKIDLSVNLVCMVNNSYFSSGAYSERKNRSIYLCPNASKSSSPHHTGELNWNSNVRSHMLSAFFYGYLISEIPAGILSSKYGSRFVMAGAMVMNSICAFLYAIAARYSYYAFFVLRFIVGIGCGCMFPSVSQIWGAWAPTSERSFLVSLATSGAHLGTIMTLPLGGILCETTLGWPGLFYVIGSLGIVWVLIWLIVFSNTPAQNRFISAREKAYLIDEIGDVKKEDHSNIPWRQVLSSKHCWGMFLCHTCMNYGFYTLLTQIPTYMKDELLFDIKSNGLLSSLPYISVWLVVCISSYVADYLMKKNYVKNRTLLRKVAVIIGSFIPGSLLIGLGFTNCRNSALAVALLTIAQGIYGVAWGAGFMVNANDLAPKMAGVIFGISNMFATIPGIIVPHIAAALTRENNGIAVEWQWRLVFIIAAIIWYFGGIIFVILGSGEAEPWAASESTEHMETAQRNDVKMSSDKLLHDDLF